MKNKDNFEYTFDLNIKKKYLRLGFGSFQIGGNTKLGNKTLNMGNQKIIDSHMALKEAIRLGINFFDTSDIYGNGRSEELIGNFINKSNKNFIVCTKYGNRIKNNKFFFDYSIKYTNISLKKSQKRLNLKCIDIFLLHSPPDDIVLDSLFKKNILALKKNNEIKAFGISCRNISSAVKFIKKYKFIDYIEVIYNIIDRRIENTLTDLCKKNNVKIIAKVPLASGFLSNKNLNNLFKKNDIRNNYDKDFIEWIRNMHLKMNFLKDKNNNLISKCLRFVLSNNNVAVIIPGMRNLNQVHHNYQSFKKGSLTKKDLTKINKLPKFFPGWN